MYMHHIRPCFPSLINWRGSCKASSHCRKGWALRLGTRSLLSLWYMKSGGHRRWPDLTHESPNTFRSTTHLWTRLYVCLSCGLPSLDTDRQKLKWSKKQTCVLQKLLHHLQQIIAQVYQGSESANPQAFQETDLRDSWDSECPKPEHRYEKPICAQVGGEKTESKVKAHMLLASVCYH